MQALCLHLHCSLIRGHQQGKGYVAIWMSLLYGDPIDGTSCVATLNSCLNGGKRWHGACTHIDFSTVWGPSKDWAYVYPSTSLHHRDWGKVEVAQPYLLLLLWNISK